VSTKILQSVIHPSPSPLRCIHFPLLFLIFPNCLPVKSLSVRSSGAISHRHPCHEGEGALSGLPNREACGGMQAAWQNSHSPLHGVRINACPGGMIPLDHSLTLCDSLRTIIDYFLVLFKSTATILTSKTRDLRRVLRRVVRPSIPLSSSLAYLTIISKAGCGKTWKCGFPGSGPRLWSRRRP
jgi:hypothetical protein